MISWLRAALRRLSPRVGGIGLAVLILGAVIFVVEPAREVSKRSHEQPTRATATGMTHGGRQEPSAVQAALIERARGVARKFLAGYLPFAYGRAPAALVRAVRPALRRQLSRERALVTPVERRRHPRVVSLTALAQAPEVVVATALIDDGGIANYALRVTVRRTSRGWIVTRVDEG